MIAQFLDFIFHMDAHLVEWIALFGPWIYLLLFLILFIETGLVIMPFLPGDSLLFALGALATVEGSTLNIWVLGVVLSLGGIIGDAVNYSIGKYFGPRVFSFESSRFFNRDHLMKTHQFYEKYGPFTIVIARFVPIIRTFAPFVAGIGTMEYKKFALYNVTGAILWVVSFLVAGYFFGNLPYVKTNFHIVIFGIIIVSVMPIVVSYIKAKIQKNPA